MLMTEKSNLFLFFLHNAEKKSWCREHDRTVISRKDVLWNSHDLGDSLSSSYLPFWWMDVQLNDKFTSANWRTTRPEKWYLSNATRLLFSSHRIVDFYAIVSSRRGKNSQYSFKHNTQIPKSIPSLRSFAGTLVFHVDPLINLGKDFILS